MWRWPWRTGKDVECTVNKQLFPFAEDPGTRIGHIIVYTVLAGFVGGYALWEMGRNTSGAWILLILALVIAMAGLPEIGELLARLQICPEGISITVFGKTLRRIPAEQIRFLSGVPGRKRDNAIPQIAVCSYSLEDLTELGIRSTPKCLRIRKERWEGEFAGSYLWKRSILKGLICERRILWLDWSPERLMLLRQMYPQAQWLDCTREGQFETQLKR